jgi:hypothetical protein
MRKVLSGVFLTLTLLSVSAVAIAKFKYADTQNGKVGNQTFRPPHIVARLPKRVSSATKYCRPLADRFCFFAVAAHVFSASLSHLQ